MSLDIASVATITKPVFNKLLSESSSIFSLSLTVTFIDNKKSESHMQRTRVVCFAI